jgi:2-hydroxychromene-2-carboxylate isomerase
MKTKRPRFYFSFRSPFAWIAARYMKERMSPEALAQVEWIPYWEPDDRTLPALRAAGGDFLYAQMGREKHLYILQDIKRLTKSLGYEHVWPIDKSPWWELPNLAYLVAARLGKGPLLREAMYRARWEKGENIHTIETVRAVAAEVGLDPDVVAGAPEDEAARKEAVDALLRAYNDGVFGVPFFVKGFEKFWGVDRLLPFIAAVEGRPFRFFWEGIPRELIDQLGVYDTDAAGGCG